MRHDESPPFDDDPRYGPELSRAFDTTLNSLVPRTDVLVAGAVAQGSRIRRRRRVALWSASVTAVVALTGSAVFVALPGLRSDGRDTVRTVALPDFALTGGSVPAGKEPVTDAAAVALLTELLPGSPMVTKSESRDNDPAHATRSAYGKVTLVNGGTVAVWFDGAFIREMKNRFRDGSASSWGWSADESESPGSFHPRSAEDLRRHYSCPGEDEYCLIDKLGDGSVVLSKERGFGSDSVLTADVVRPDGSRVLVIASGTDYRLAQVQALATDKRWQQWVAPEVNHTARNAWGDPPEGSDRWSRSSDGPEKEEIKNIPQ